MFGCFDATFELGVFNRSQDTREHRPRGVTGGDQIVTEHGTRKASLESADDLLNDGLVLSNELGFE